MDDLISRQAASEEKMRIVIDNYFKSECNVNTSIRQAFEKGFKIGVKKGLATQPERKKGYWIHISDDADGNSWYECSCCHKGEVHVPIVEVSYCWNCGARMEEEQTDDLIFRKETTQDD